jgi:hypothetical protein
MSIAIQAVSSPPLPARFEARPEPSQSDPGSIAPFASPQAGYDGHVGVPAYFALWLELLELMQEQRAADRALSSQVGLVTQELSRAQARHVRDEGGQIFAGALAGAVMGFAIGAAGAAISHRAFGKQAGGAAPVERSRSGRAAGDAHGVDGVGNGSLPARPDIDDLPGLGDIDGSSRAFARMRFNEPDIGSVTPRLSRSGSVASTGSQAQRSEPGEIEGPPFSVRGMRFNEPDIGPVTPPLSRQGSVRSTTSHASRPDHSDPLDPFGPATIAAPADHPDSSGRSDSMRASRKGLIGQMLVANAASLAAVGAAGGQMSAALERADAGLLQTGGMISESTKHNRGEEARNGNEAVSRTLGALRDQNQDLRQTVSQIVSSIRA